MLVGAAASWAISIVIVRAHRFTATTLALAPWQMLVAVCLLLPLAGIVEGAPRFDWRIVARPHLRMSVQSQPRSPIGQWWKRAAISAQVRCRWRSWSTPSLGIMISALALW